MTLPNGSKSSNGNKDNHSAILYIMVIGFHHKKGCQLEFVYPIDNRISKQNVSQIEGPNNTPANADLYKLPSKWRNLPSLALPDGSHHYESDFIYFHLEDDNELATGDTRQTNDEANLQETNKSKSKPQPTIFGISCYRQIDVSQVINKDSDVTRNTIQKSVCVLSTRPFYSGIRLKLQTITNAYFEQKDFHKTDLLVDAYFSLSKTFSHSIQTVNIDNKLTTTAIHTHTQDAHSQYLSGFSLTDLILRYQHKILVLFKLFLLQKKCLFQLKPVSNLSNTIMTIVSLVPDLFETNGLMHCSGFFDSIDLVNSELDRKEKKNNNRNVQLKSTNNFLSNQSNNNNGGYQKFSKKKKMSFSKKKTSTSNGANSGSSLVSSLSSVSIKTLSESFNNSFKNSSNNDSSINNNSQNNSQSERDLENLDDETNTTTSNKSEVETQENNNLGDLIKSKVNSVFKLVDWTGASSSPTSNTSSPTNLTNSSSQQSKSDKENKKLNNSKSSNKLSDLDSLNNTIEFESNTNEAISNKSSMTKSNVNNNLDLLEYDFGMPINLFNQFNILHPYLSLYYLEYFTMINKMNTKLFCTTTLMMSMIKDKQQQPEKASEEKSNAESTTMNNNDKTVFDDKPTSETVNSAQQSSFIPGKQSTNVFGYTIGATNILFKQRLCDELDAIIDETDIDFRNNEALKKQLQLSTADLRFVDYIIKNINSSSKSNQTVTNTPTLLSFKKTSSFSNIMNDINDDSILSTNNTTSNVSWEGSEEWVRLNFKLYFYSLLASVVKEEVCELVLNEMNTILLSLNNDKFTSSSSSSSSLPNEVIDIEDYIEKVSTKQVNSNDQQQSDQDNQQPSSNDNDSGFKIKKKNRKNSIVSVSSNILSNTSHSDFREDFNTNYIHELKNTEWYKEWSELNHDKLAKSIFKLDLQQYNSQTIQATNATPSELNSRLQILVNQMQELDKVKISHPFNGQISVNDIKLKLNVLFNTTESGRKINKALIEGGKIVNSTGKAVGDAFTQAKSTFSSFLSNWSSPSSSPFTKNNNSNKD